MPLKPKIGPNYLMRNDQSILVPNKIPERGTQIHTYDILSYNYVSYLKL